MHTMNTKMILKYEKWTKFMQKQRIEQKWDWIENCILLAILLLFVGKQCIKVIVSLVQRDWVLMDEWNMRLKFGGKPFHTISYVCSEERALTKASPLLLFCALNQYLSHIVSHSLTFTIKRERERERERRERENSSANFIIQFIDNTQHNEDYNNFYSLKWKRF